MSKKVAGAMASTIDLTKYVFDYSPIGKAIVDLNGSWILVNDSLCSLIGYKRSELLNTKFSDIVHPKDLPIDVNLVGSLLNREKTSYERETRYITKTGIVINVLMTAFLVWENLDPKYFIINVQNIEERKQLEHQNRLIRKNLEKISNEKDHYLTTVSHELRSPLTNIKMAISMIRARQKDQLPTGLEKYIDILDHECAREITLINDLLDLQRLDSGYDESDNKETINLSQWLNISLESFAGLNSVFVKDIEDDIFIDFNLNNINRIVGELLTNACKYTDEDEEIYVTLKRDTKKISLSIKNSATLTNEDVENIFKKFVRLNPSKGKVRKTGTGLGLPLIKKLIQVTNCKLKVNNQCGFIEMIFIIPLDYDSRTVLKK